MRELRRIASGVVQANTGQTTVFDVPDWARYASFFLKVKDAAGTTPLTDLVLYAVAPEITSAVVVATGTAGDGTHDEVQTITLTGGPTHGTWAFTWPGVSAVGGATVSGLRAAAAASEVQDALNAALPIGGTYEGRHIVVTRTGSGTSGAPYVYTLTFSGATVDKTDVDACTADGTDLYTFTTDTDFGAGNVWNGITQIAGTTAGGIAVHVGPGVTGIADDDTGNTYFLNAPLTSRMAAAITFDRTTGNEVYTYSLFADYSS